MELKEKFRRIICVEEHFSFPDHIKLLSEKISDEQYILQDAPFLCATDTEPVKKMLKRLFDVGPKRLREMDENNIDVQILSLVSPGVQVFEPKVAVKLARKYNDKLHSLIKKSPGRFYGLACIAPQFPEEAAEELERCVTELCFRGVIINSHTNGEYLDNKKYWIIFEKAEKLNVPIYLHPRSPSPQMIKPYLDYPMLASALWGFEAETGLHALRLLLSGVFDRFPALKIVLGHLGELIPAQLRRIDKKWEIGPFEKSLKKLPSEYFKANFYVTTSGMFVEEVLKMVIDILSADKVLFAIDYPMEDPKEALEFIEMAKIDDEQKRKILHMNAEKVFNVSAMF